MMLFRLQKFHGNPALVIYLFLLLVMISIAIRILIVMSFAQLVVPSLSIHSISCSSNKSQCQSAHVTLAFGTIMQNYSNFEDLMSQLDANPKMMRIVIDTSETNATVSRYNTSQVSMVLDKFLTPRLWWVVIYEKSRESWSKRSKGYHAVLHRFEPSHEQQLRILSAIQYAPKNECNSIPLQLARMLNKGWGSQLTLMEILYTPFHVLNIWDSNTNEASERIMYASLETCPNIVNKRECMNLPMTSCEMPINFMSAKGNDVNTQFWKNRDVIYFSSASNNGVIQDNLNNLSQMIATNEYIRKVKAQFGYEEKTNKPAESSVFMDNQGKEMKNKNWGSVLAPYALMIRPNAIFRKLSSDIIHEFRRFHRFPTTEKCTTIHIRRGDRILKDSPLTIQEYCSQYKMFAANGSCLHIPSQQWVVCSSPDDFGCFSHNSFGGLTLHDYLKAAKMISSANTVFISTDDDGSWLEEEMKTLPQQWANWKVVALLARNDFHSIKLKDGGETLQKLHLSSISMTQLNATENNKMNRTPINNIRKHLLSFNYDDVGLASIGVETLGGLEFLSSIALARQCDSYVGHFSSGFSVSLYRLMCFHHGQSTGKCPNAIDIGNIYNDQGNTIFANTVG